MQQEMDRMKQDMAQMRKEKAMQASEFEAKISDLEISLVEMKLNLAQAKTREDHHRMSMAKLEMGLQQSQSNSHDRSQGRRLTKSMTSADSPVDNVRSGQPPARKNNLLTKSWFGRDRQNKVIAVDGEGNGLGGSFFKRERSPTSSPPTTFTAVSLESPSVL